MYYASCGPSLRECLLYLYDRRSVQIVWTPGIKGYWQWILRYCCESGHKLPSTQSGCHLGCRLTSHHMWLYLATPNIPRTAVLTTNKPCALKPTPMLLQSSTSWATEIAFLHLSIGHNLLQILRNQHPCSRYQIPQLNTQLKLHSVISASVTHLPQTLIFLTASRD